MILLTRRVPAEGRSMLGYLDCLYHVAKASEKRLDNGLIERDFARLRCPKMSHFEFCPRRRAKNGFPVVGSHSERDSAELACCQQKGPRLLSRGRKKTVLQAARMEGILTRQEAIIGCTLGKASGLLDASGPAGRLSPSPPSLAPPRARGPWRAVSLFYGCLRPCVVQSEGGRAFQTRHFHSCSSPEHSTPVLRFTKVPVG